MNKRYKIILLLLLVIGIIVMATAFLRGTTIAVLSPRGLIAQKERNLIIFASLLSLIVVIPVFIMTFTIAWKYREGNTKAKYTPDWDHNVFAETIWWLIPLALILVLSVMTWKSTHQLDPRKPLGTTTKPLTIQVVALQWKWLFIYPVQNIASVNFVQFPQTTPINFEITADAPMNSFWIPRLGGQIYAMSGMSTHLNLISSGVGDFNGSSANISGEGFAGMKFIARASTGSDFDGWVQSVKQSSNRLGLDEYKELAQPSLNNPSSVYFLSENNLYNKIVMKFMDPSQRELSGGHAGSHKNYRYAK